MASESNRSVCLFRHAEQDRAPAKVAGIWQEYAVLNQAKAASQVAKAATALKAEGITKFDLFGHSLLIRARQTAELLRSEFGQAALPTTLVSELGPGEIPIWESSYRELIEHDAAFAEKPPTAQQMVGFWGRLLSRETERVLSGVRLVAQLLRPGQRAAVVSHHPLVALTGILATGRLITDAQVPDFDFCQSTEFVFRDAEIVSVLPHATSN